MKTIALIGAPTDVGAAHRGASMGPEALRVAGIDTVLRRLGHDVVDLGNLAGPPNPNARPVDGYRHLAEVAQWCRSLAEAVHEQLGAGRQPIAMGGDHCLAIGSIAGVARFCAERGTPLSVLWFDAHADFNTPATSPSGNIHGMPVAVLNGFGPEELLAVGHKVPLVDGASFYQVGIRSVDLHEKQALAASNLSIYDMRTIDERGIPAVMREILESVALAGGHLHVSFDVDFLDPSLAPGVGTTVKGGPNYREAQLCMEMVYDSGLMASLDVMEVNPAIDLRNSTAEIAVELVASLFGEQILARHRPSK